MSESGGTVPIIGRVAELSTPINNVGPGMSFRFNGKTLAVFGHEPLGAERLSGIFFDGLLDRGQATDSFVSCDVSATGERAVFHVTGRPGFRNGSVLLGVCDYWVLRGGAELGDVALVAYSGPCVDSFCPLRGAKAEDDGRGLSLRLPALHETVLSGGSAEVAGRQISVETVVGWRLDALRTVTIESSLRVFSEGADYEFLHALYVGVSRALRFFLGRGNVVLSCSLLASEGGSRRKIGDFVACHGKLYVPDEHDEPKESFVRAKDIGEGLAPVIGACSSGAIDHPVFAETREDANIITYAKAIELTAQFEKEFRETFPDGVAHSPRKLKAQEAVRSVLEDAGKAEGMNSASRKILSNLAPHIGDDNLQTRISSSLKDLPEPVVAVAKRGVEKAAARRDVGERIASVRNSVAHGLVFRYDLADVREEYLLLTRLVFALRLKGLGFGDEDVARLLKCMP